MKTDLATAIIAAIAGVLVSYLVVANLLMKDPAPVTIKAPNTTITPNLSEPSPEVFNYRAINPTVEAYVDCTNYDVTGNCVNVVPQEENAEE